jgi:type 1 fimbria pilin
MASLKFQKSALAISFSAALLSMFVASPAQSANDFGELIINGQISNTTCLLTLGDGGATGSNSRTINLGTFSTATAGASGIGSTIGNKQHAILGLKAADGVSPCTFIGNTKWDVGVNISPENIDADVGTGVLKNTAATNAATGVGVQLMTTVGALGTTAGTTPVNFANSSPTYGTLLSGSATSALGVLPAQVIAVTVQMVRTGVIGAGVFTHSIPLNVWYQ